MRHALRPILLFIVTEDSRTAAAAPAQTASRYRQQAVDTTTPLALLQRPVRVPGTPEVPDEQ